MKVQLSDLGGIRSEAITSIEPLNGMEELQVNGRKSRVARYVPCCL